MARSSPIRCGPKIRNGSEWVPERKLFSSSGGNPATAKGFMTIQPRVRAWLFNRSEEHTSELQSQSNLVCRLLLEKKKTRANEHLPSKEKAPPQTNVKDSRSDSLTTPVTLKHELTMDRSLALQRQRD